MDRILLGSIFRKLPLKLLLVILAVFAVFVAFTKADSVNISYISIPTTSRWYQLNNDSQKDMCIFNGSYDTFLGVYSIYNDLNSTIVELEYLDTYCTDSSTINVRNNYGYGSVNFAYFTLPDKYTSLQCQTEYNLIPISSVDQNYCTTNNLCPSIDCPEYPDNPNLGTSNIYINDIFHPGAFNIIMNIPEEIDWDYAYTNSGSNFNVDIVGYNQDFEKIEGWIKTNNYKPSSEDFTNIFTGGFSNFGGLLVATLFVILVFYFVKKMFK